MNLYTQLSANRALYDIRVRGHLDENRQLWFEGMMVKPLAGDETSIWGVVQDQSALFGLLTKIRDMGLVLLSVRRIEG
jgi:hypothetical protein